MPCGVAHNDGMSGRRTVAGVGQRSGTQEAVRSSLHGRGRCPRQFIWQSLFSVFFWILGENEKPMAFDPTKPENGTDLDAVEIRNQLNGLKALIDAVPAGPAGPQGPVGPALANIQIGSVSTGTPGSSASAWVNISGNDAMIHFTIPAGETGATGEVSTSALASEISGTARNPNSVSTLPFTVSNPPTQAELQAVVDKLNELIGSLQR